MSKLMTALLCVCFAPRILAVDTFDVALTITDLKTGLPVAGATVILEDGRPAPPVNKEIIQKHRQFQPQSLVVPVGSTVAFPNLDVTQHHVYSFSPAKVFDIELYAGEPETPVLFDKTGVVELGCNIHDQMQAFILVTNSAVKVETNADGKAKLSLPKYLHDSDALAVAVWHPRLKNATQPALFQIQRSASMPLVLSVDLTPQAPVPGRLDRLQQRFRDL